MGVYSCVVAQPPAPGAVDLNQTPLSYLEKQTLRTDIFRLDGDKLERVVEIIQANLPPNQNAENDDEIEIDIDQLNIPTLRTLQKYVRECLGGGDGGGGGGDAALDSLKRRRDGDDDGNGGGGGAGADDHATKKHHADLAAPFVDPGADFYSAADAVVTHGEAEMPSFSDGKVLVLFFALCPVVRLCCVVVLACSIVLLLCLGLCVFSHPCISRSVSLRPMPVAAPPWT